MIRRRSFRRIKKTKKSFASLSAKELYSYAYYLYTASKVDDLSDITIEFYEAIYNLATKLKKKKKFENVLELCIKDLEEKKFIKVIKTRKKTTETLSDFLEDQTEDSLEDQDSLENTKTRYDIDNEIYRRNTYLSEVELNYHRCLFAESRIDGLKGLFGKVIFLTFFTEESQLLTYSKYSIDKIFSQKIKEIYMEKINDLKDVDFLLKEIFLTKEELNFLQFNYRRATFPDFSNLYDTNYFSDLDNITIEILGLSSNEYSKIFRNDSNLTKFGFIDEDGYLSDDFFQVIENKDLNLYFSDLIKEIDVNDSFKLNSFSVNKSKTRILCEMLKKQEPVSILLYGKPGSGKTEYAKALAKATGKKTILFKNESEINDEKYTSCKLNLLLSLEKKDTILIVDEAESVLKTKEMTFFGPITSKKKGVINKMLDESKNQVIWIVNHTNQFDESTKRRFTMSCKFESMPKKILDNIITSKLKPLSLSEEIEKDILNRFEKYNITGASVDNVVKAISSFNKISEKEIKENVEIVLKENSLLINGNSKMRDSVDSSYDCSVLNTSIDANKIAKMVKNAQKFAENNQLGKNSAIRMLFYGVSGTGKTEFARYLSDILGKKILLKRASDIFDKYVGGTESNIAEAFAEAAEKDQILLFDEADSFFSDRNNAVRNWERTQVNEFLTQMEEFPGILICTTNLKNIMDKATLRRFHITVEFNPLEKEGIKTLLQKFFPAYFSNAEIEKLSLSSLTSYNSVTPGDFGSLAGKIRFMDEEEISSERIIQELCAMQEEKDGSKIRKIGFAV